MLEDRLLLAWEVGFHSGLVVLTESAAQPFPLGSRRQSSLCCVFSALPEDSPAVGLRTPTLPCLAAHSPATQCHPG